MKKSVLLLMFSLLCGCSLAQLKPAGADAMARAIREVRSGRAQCVLILPDGEFLAERGRGVSPLLKLYDEHPSAMKGATVVDKVIGRAAASIAICGKAAHVHGELMSEDAAEFLTANGVSCSQTKMVPRILNQNRSGLCPLEKSVLGIEDPEKALNALRNWIQSHKAPQKKSGQFR